MAARGAGCSLQEALAPRWLPCSSVCMPVDRQVQRCFLGRDKNNVLCGCAALQTNDQDNEMLVRKLRERFER